MIVGASGGELGIRGFVAAFDLDTGKPLWKVFSVPAPGEPGSETWPKGDQWKTGGGSIWVSGNYDPATNLAYWGTGNGGPWMGDQRPGDNLYTSSTIAIDLATGTIKGHFQYHPNDSWDWDEVSPPILVDYTRNGRTIKGLIDVARDGYLWFLERTDSRINFVQGLPFVKQNVFTSLDPKTGRPEVDPAHKPGTGKKADVLPVAVGRQELAADRLQPEDADDLHPGQRESLLGQRRRADLLHARRTLHRRDDRVLHRARRRPHRRSAGVERGHRQARVDAPVQDVAKLGADAGDRRRRRLQRRHQRPEVSRVRRVERQAVVGVPDQLRHHRPAVVVHGQRQAVRRGAVRVGHRLERACRRGSTKRRRETFPTCRRVGRSGCLR